ncbi:uncharacterized protein LOC116654563 [Drosophila ananassae]|uniref:uncharacterized protein LOC116654563 n=1 Tax=Drosophila ananassae TaxID=7217 RepID=UPI001CFF7706|nr:uncharacterized protein LOC116654563 [Drosophila ananassae]
MQCVKRRARVSIPSSEVCSFRMSHSGEKARGAQCFRGKRSRRALSAPADVIGIRMMEAHPKTYLAHLLRMNSYILRTKPKDTKPPTQRHIQQLSKKPFMVIVP